MKLCVNARQELEYIKLANELVFNYKDREAIPDFIEKYPDKTMVLVCENGAINWNSINELNNERLICKVYSINAATVCKNLGIRFFFGYPICSYDELTAALAMGSEYVRLGAPLFFDLDNVTKFFPNANIRLVPNVAYDDLYDRPNGIAGTWIRPEDIKMYFDYAKAIEFEKVELPQERALVRIYWQEREWPGELSMIIPDIRHKAVNNMLVSDISEKRLNCRQICKSTRTCHICQRAFDLADPDLILNYKEAITPKYEAPKNDN